MVIFATTCRPGHPIRAASVVLCTALLAACSPPPPPGPLTGTTMGTAYTVKFAKLPAELSPATLQALVEQQLAAVNAVMSTYDADAEISRFNRDQNRDWFSIAPEMAAVLVEAKAIHDRSGGAFDVTIGPVVEIWGFGAAGPRDKPPPQSEITAALARVGMDDLMVRRDPSAVRKLRSDLQIDLSAIAKGHAVDRVATALENAGVTNYLVEIGGELRTAGRRPDGGVWRVGIEQPATGGRSVQRAIPMALDGAVATSGDYRNFFEIDGRRYAHILDPRTGRPVEHRLASVTVIAANCSTADGWATALSVLGTDAGYRVAESEGLAALFIDRDGEKFSERATPAFDNWLETGKILQGEATNDD